MSIIVKEELRLYIDPLSEQEYATLEKSVLAEGCRDPLVLWGDILIDGHNRYEICSRHHIPFQTIQRDGFDTIEDVMLWMIDNQLGRRSVTDFQRGMLALRKQELVAAREAAQASVDDTAKDLQTATGINEGLGPTGVVAEPDSSEHTSTAGDRSAATKDATRSTPVVNKKEVAQIAGVSSHAIMQIERIRKTAVPELVHAVRAGTISISAAAAVASLSEEQQRAAVSGGRKDLQTAARSVREARQAQRVRNEPASHTDGAAVPQEASSAGAHASAITERHAGAVTVGDEHEWQRLRQEVEQLRADNARLRAALQAAGLALPA